MVMAGILNGEPAQPIAPQHNVFLVSSVLGCKSVLLLFKGHSKLLLRIRGFILGLAGCLYSPHNEVK